MPTSHKNSIRQTGDHTKIYHKITSIPETPATFKDTVIRTGNNRTGNLSNFWVILRERHLKTKVDYGNLSFHLERPSQRTYKSPSIVIVPSTCKQKKTSPWRIQGRSPGPRLILRPKWDPKSRKRFVWDRAPPYLRVWMTGAPDPYLKILSEDLVRL